MKCINDWIFVSYDDRSKFYHTLPNGVELVIPIVWEQRDEYGFYTGQRTENLDRKEANPQVCYVLSENPRYPEYKVGDKLFTHYLEYENGDTVLGEVTGKMIKGNSVFFKVGEGGEMLPTKGTYIAERIAGKRFTPLGILLPDWIPNFKKCHVRLTVTPTDSPYNVGDVVLTIDDNQYMFEYEGKVHVKVYDHEIIGVAD